MPKEVKLNPSTTERISQATLGHCRPLHISLPIPILRMTCHSLGTVAVSVVKLSWSSGREFPMAPIHMRICA
ncbi:hypothetical protein AFLA_013852 [Aspergillus flavus NRRL3357]|nr:hypothetical protein AFLA_013852 [Aspergillus flavus NRRL3357]